MNGRRIGATAGTLLALWSAGHAQYVERDSGGIFVDTRTELLFDGAHFSEGPAMGPDGLLYFSDITWTSSSGMQAGHIWRLDPATGHSEVFRSPSGMSNGLLFDLEGRLVAALGADFGGRAVVRTDPSNGKSYILAGLYNGRSFNSPNDLAIDEQGRIYFTDPRYNGHEPMEQPFMGVYRIDPDGTLTRLLTRVGHPNGILVSPDQQTLYVSSAEYPFWGGINALMAFTLGADGSVSERRVLADCSGDAGPDGMAIDVNGNIYAARPANTDFGVYVYSPEGEELAYLRTAESPSNVAFGIGEYSKTIFITAREYVFSIRTATDGYRPTWR
jgi:gluconolactonase